MAQLSTMKCAPYALLYLKVSYMNDKSNFGYETMRHGVATIGSKYKMLNVALCDARHPIPGVTDSVFPQVVEKPLDFTNNEKVAYDWMRNHMDFIKEKHDREVPNRVNLYVTGLTPCLIAFLQEWGHSWPCELYLMHWDRETGEYVEDFWAGCM